ncbi:MAG: hypothetical protein NVS3B7_12680 [Candidatus Elarobacter sp.]
MIWFAPFEGFGDEDLVVTAPWPKAPPRPHEDAPARDARSKREPEEPHRARASIK